jgi:uncharacterized repeat protein (TIGR03803 family)
MRIAIVIAYTMLTASCMRTVPTGTLPAGYDAISLARVAYKLLYSFKAGEDAGVPDARLTNVDGTLYGTTYGGGGGYEWGTVYSITTDGVEHVLHRFKAGKDGAHPEGALTNVNGTLYGTTYQGGATGSGTVFAITTTGKEHVVYSFKGGDDGQYPYCTLLAVGGNLYGTTFQGGTSSGWGVVFKLTTTGSEHVLYRFQANNDGAHPYAGLILANGKLYGTTYQGGMTGSGTVYSITTAGVEHVIYSFQGGNDGQYPYAGLTDIKNELYGTTYQGGISTGWGTVFKVNPSGGENVLYRFRAGLDGAHPVYSGVSFANGMLYGTTYQGGSKGSGIVYGMTLGGSEKVLYSFKGGADGLYPYAGLIDVDGTFYGTTTAGGTGDCSGTGCGTVFKITP